jgi:hypothetical protein
VWRGGITGAEGERQEALEDRRLTSKLVGGLPRPWKLQRRRFNGGRGRGRMARWRRLRLPRVDSLEGENEGDTLTTMAWTTELVGASNDGDSRRPSGYCEHLGLGFRSGSEGDGETGFLGFLAATRSSLEMPAGGGAHLNAGGRREAASELLGQTEVGDDLAILQETPWVRGGLRWASAGLLGCARER